MPFLSVEFAIFWLCFLPIYWAIGQYPRYQNKLLLVTSMLLLANIHVWFAIAVTVFTILIFLIARKIFKSTDIKQRKRWLIAGIVISVLNLGLFKYFDFFRLNMKAFFQSDIMEIMIPLGMSYYTFQAIAYLVFIYKQEDNTRLSFPNLLLHFSFFPTITSGPIIRAGVQKSVDGIQAGISTQILTTQPRYILRPALALALILLGVIKKWWLVGVLADTWVNPVFENPLQYDVLSVLAAIYGYTFQLFLDFSGYTDLVIGLAMFLGFQLPKNFSMPLITHNIRSFWERWHMTLSAWIRDYIYIPLGGNRLGFWRTQRNVLLAMVLSGIWHGYGWNFFLWGLLHGLAFIGLNLADRIFGRDALASRFKWGKFLGILTTISFVSASFVVFRTDSLAEANLIFYSLLGGGRGWMLPELDIVLLLAIFALVLCTYRWLVRGFYWAVYGLERLPVCLWFVPISLILLFLLIVAPSGIPGFIYANF